MTSLFTDFFSTKLTKPEIFSSDKLHMNEDGYKLWTEIVAPYLPKPDRP